jgi:lysophospholipase L1-like esterase
VTDALLSWANTTPVLWGDPGFGRTDPDVQLYNAVAGSIMAEKGIEIHDLYGLVKPLLGELQAQAYDSDVHFTEEGYEVLGQAVAQAIMLPESTQTLLHACALATLALLRRRAPHGKDTTCECLSGG